MCIYGLDMSARQFLLWRIHHLLFAAGLVVLLSFSSEPAHSNKEGGAPAVLPPSFRSLAEDTESSKKIVPIDIKHLTVKYAVHCNTKQATAVANLSFVPKGSGYPMFDLVSPSIQKVTLNGKALDASTLRDTKDPHSKTRFLVLGKRVESSRLYRLSLQYKVKKKHLSFVGKKRVKNFFFWMTDNEGRERRFLEQYAPANFEGDQFRLRIFVKLHGCQGPHFVVSNARSTQELEKNTRWVMRFPSYYNSSSPFMHLFSSKHHFSKFTVPSGSRAVPVVVYGKRKYVVKNATRRVKRYFRQYEKRFGRYSHANLLVRVFARKRYHHSMEYAGAIVATHLGALRHEMSHMWFGRGVFPANGNAGWLDEAIATWSECVFCSFESLRRRKRLKRVRGRGHAPISLTCGSNYRRTTIWNSYKYGMRALVEMDYLLRRRGKPGMVSLLRGFYQRYRKEIVTAEDIYRFFWKHKVLRWHFRRFVMGNRSFRECFRKARSKKL